MPSEAGFVDFYLLIKPRTGGKGRDLLEAYDAATTGPKQPLASAAAFMIRREAAR